MNDYKNIYRKIIQEEVESPEVQDAKEAFLREHFESAPVSPWAFLAAPAFRWALVGCFAVLVVLKSNVIQNPHGTVAPLPVPAVEQPVAETVQNQAIPAAIELSAEAVAPESDKVVAAEAVYQPNGIKIQKLASDMGATVAYQKHFSDVQITVVWVIPKGV